MFVIKEVYSLLTRSKAVAWEIVGARVTEIRMPMTTTPRRFREFKTWGKGRWGIGT